MIEIRDMTPHAPGGAFGDHYEATQKKFMEDHPNVKILHDVQPSAQLRTKITVEMAAGNPPHTAWNILSYAREFMRDDKIIDWRPVYEDPKHPEFKKWFTKTVLETPTDDKGRIMMAPYEAHIDGLFYNQAAFQKYGLTTPKSFEEFVGLGPKARGQGIVAMVTGGKDIRFAWFASIMLVRAGGLQNARALAIGDAKDQWNNPKYGFPQSMQKFEQMVKAGVYPDGVLGMDQNEANQIFATGGALTYYEGQWRPNQWRTIGGEDFYKNDLRRMDFPPMTDMPMGEADVRTGGVIAGRIVASVYSQEEIDASIAWTKYVSDPAFNIANLESESNLYAGNVKWNEAAASVLWKQVVEAFRTAPAYIPSMDTFAPPAVDLTIKKSAMPGIITGEFTADQAVAEVQKAAEEYVKSLQ
jgi:raffinose/stachyose/melibiose transport system substrate-binding protein